MGCGVARGRFNRTEALRSRWKLRFGYAMAIAAAIVGTPAEPADAQAPSTSREWVDSSGQFKIRAVYVGRAANGGVVLRRDDGTEVTVPMERLSAADQGFLKSLEQPIAQPADQSGATPSEGADGNEESFVIVQTLVEGKLVS
jgi:hypothetical protein